MEKVYPKNQRDKLFLKMASAADRNDTTATPQARTKRHLLQQTRPFQPALLCCALDDKWRTSNGMRHIDKVTNKNWLNEQESSQITDLIASSFKGVDSQLYFQRYFNNQAHYQRCVRLFYQQEQLMGYCLLTFSKNANHSIVMGASAAFFASYRGNNNTFTFSFLWALKTWLRHINHKVYYLDTMLSPAMYRAMGKKVAFIYPNPLMTTEDMAIYQALVPEAEPSPWQQLPCLKNVGRSTNYSDDEVQSLKASSKAEIAFYCQVNPNFAQGSALLVLIPVNLKQIVCTLWKWVSGAVRLTAPLSSGK